MQERINNQEIKKSSRNYCILGEEFAMMLQSKKPGALFIEEKDKVTFFTG